MEILLNNFDEEALERLRNEFRKSPTDGLVFEEFVRIMIKALPHLYKLQRPVASMPRASSFEAEEALKLLALMTPDRLWRPQKEWDEAAAEDIEQLADHNNRITRKEFDALAARRTELVEHKKLVRLVVLLRDLFDEIDVNGDGIMEWDEFTGYCVELGFVATRRQAKPLEFKYACDENYTDTVSKGPQIQQLLYVPEKDQVFVVESNSPTVAIYDAHLKLQRIFEPPPSFGAKSSSNATAPTTDITKRAAITIGAATIRSVTYIPPRNWLAVATSDQRLTYYDCNMYQPRFSVHSTVQQCVGMWNEMGQFLITGGVNGTLFCWDVYNRQKYDSLSQHTDAITGLVEIPMHKCIVSCAADGKVLLWEQSKDKVTFKGELKGGHKRTVRSVVFSEKNDLLITAGFEYEAIGWDLATRCPMLRLKGHRKSLVGVTMVPMSDGNELALTADMEGTFKLWEIRRTLTGMAPCVQTIDIAMQPATLAFIGSTSCVVSASSKMHILKPIKQKVEHNIPVCAIYNSVSMTILVAAGRNIHIYDARTGALRNEFYEIVPHEITSVCLDHRQRKFIVGTAGGQVQVHNYLNGAPMKTFDFKHDRDISALLYCNEDKVLITTGWDRRVCIYDETPREAVSLLRMVNGAHERDIGCLGFSHRLSLIATGSADFTVRLWDFQLAKKVAVLRGHTSEVGCVAFCDPYALLLSADSLGNIFFWHVRPNGKSNLNSRRNLCAVLKNATPKSDPEILAAEEEAQLAAERAANGDEIHAGAAESKVKGEDVFLTALATDDDESLIEGAVSVEEEEDSADIASENNTRSKSQRVFMAAVMSMVIVRLTRAELRDQEAAYKAYKNELARQALLDSSMNGGENHHAAAVKRSREVLPTPRGTSSKSAAKPAEGGAASDAASSDAQASTETPVTNADDASAGDTEEKSSDADAQPSTTNEGAITEDDDEIVTLLYTGDDVGVLRCWDLTQFLKELETTAAIPDEEKLPPNQAGYNPRRRIVDNIKHAANDGSPVQVNDPDGASDDAAITMSVSAPRSLSAIPRQKPSPPKKKSSRKRGNFKSVRMNNSTQRKEKAEPKSPSASKEVPVVDMSPDSPLMYDFPCRSAWQGHKDCVRSLESIERPRCLLTASQDMSVRLWSLRGIPCGVVAEHRSSKQVQKKNEAYNFPVSRTFEEDLRAAEAEEVLAKIGSKEAASAELSKQEQDREEKHKEWQIKKLQEEESRRKAAEGKRPTPIRRKSVRHHPAQSPEQAEAKVEPEVPKVAKPRKKSPKISTAPKVRPKQRQNILGQLAASKGPESASRHVANIKLRDESDKERYERLKEIPKSFQRLQSVPVSAYKNFLSEWRRAPGGPEAPGSGSTRSKLELQPSPFLQQKLGKKLLVPKLPSQGVQRAAAAARNGRNRLAKLKDPIPPISGELSFDGSELSSLGSPLGFSVPGETTSDATGLRARGLQSPWRIKGDELLSRVDLLASSTTEPEDVSTKALHGRSIVDVLLHEEEEGNVLERTQRALSRFDRLTAETDTEMESINFSKPEFFGGYKYEDVKKLRHMMKTLGVESDGTFNWDKLSSLEEWATHPLRDMVSALNIQKSVDAWCDNIDYMDQQIAGRKKEAEEAERRRRLADANSGVDKKRKHFGPYTIKEVLELKMLFDSMDEDGSGEIDAQEFLSSPAWQSSHLCTTASTVFNTIDADHDGKITLGELLAITFPGAKSSERKAMKEYLDVVSVTKPVVKTRERRLDKVELEEIEEMFRVFDLDGNGTVSINELIETLKMMGSYGQDLLSIEDLEKIAAKYDTDGDKDLNLQEFQELMKVHYLNTEPGFV